MGKWEKWAKVATGPYQGTPDLTAAGLAASGYVIDVRDRVGNVIRYIPATPGATGAIVNIGGAGVIAQLALGPTRIGGFLATGRDKCLYHIESNGSQYRWQKTFGPGQFLGAVFSWTTLDGYAEILGEGAEHQLAYVYLTPKQSKDNIKEWENLGQPGEDGGKKGLNGRPAVVFDEHGLHVLVRGQDNHLWHIYGKNNGHQGKRVFDRWTNLGGGLTQVPVAVRVQNGIECFVIGENEEPFVNTWNGTHWSGFKSMGGQLKGLPAAIYLYGSCKTFVFGRGLHDKLWYCQRDGANWQEWQSIGEGLTGDPAVWEESLADSGEGFISCVVLRQNGELWLRELQLTKEEYSGEQL